MIIKCFLNFELSYFLLSAIWLMKWFVSTNPSIMLIDLDCAKQGAKESTKQKTRKENKKRNIEGKVA